MRILVVDDSPEILSAVRRGLERRAYDVVTAADASAARTAFSRTPPDLVILDLMLPDADGLEVCGELQEMRPTPIIMLTARDGVHDRVAGLRAGADDYIVKPFALEELVARVEAVLRRRGDQDGRLAYADMVMDLAAHRVFRGDDEILLTATEFRILELLARRPDRVVTRAAVAGGVWPDAAFVDDNLLDTHVNNLRRKLEAAGRARLIQTVRGVGFVLR